MWTSADIPLVPAVAGRRAAVRCRSRPCRWRRATGQTARFAATPSLFARLGEQANKTFLIDPTDLPFVFRLQPHLEAPTLEAVRREDAGLWDARIGGPLAALLGLVHGAYDGDALFFSRDLVIEGDVEAVLALRNAIDDAEIDLASEAAALFGPFGLLASAPARKVCLRRRPLIFGVALTRAKRAPRMSRDPSYELVCPAGTPAALRAAVDAGADTVYCGFNDETNARNFPGLNFTARRDGATASPMRASRGAKVLIAINTFPRAGAVDLWHRAVDDAAALGADAVILADIGLLAYAAKKHPNLRLHLSVQAAAANPDAIDFYASASASSASCCRAC